MRVRMAALQEREAAGEAKNREERRQRAKEKTWRYQQGESNHALAAIPSSSQTVSMETRSNTALTAKELAAYVGPELLHDVEGRIEADLLNPFVGGLPKASVSSRVVEI